MKTEFMSQSHTRGSIQFQHPNKIIDELIK